MNESKIGSRHLARIKALCALYNCEVGHTEIIDALENIIECEEYTPSTNEYADVLATGVADKSLELDELIGMNLTVDWVLERLTIIDKTILKMAVYEMKYVDDVPVAVAIDEAVEIAKKYSTDSAPKFINGVLGSISKNLI